MELTVDVKLNLKVKEMDEKVRQVAEQVFKDTTIAVAQDVVHGSPYRWGTNRRSIQYDILGLTSTIFSTSGYGGYLETGTYKMPARPYFKPALDTHFTAEKMCAAMREKLK